MSKSSKRKKVSNYETAGYYGVSWSGQFQIWKVRVAINKKRVFIGSFGTEEDAARAYNKTIIDRGLNKKLNLDIPDTETKSPRNVVFVPRVSDDACNEKDKVLTIPRCVLPYSLKQCKSYEHSKYNGVWWNSTKERWMVKLITKKERTIHDGMYLTEEEAAKVYNQLAIKNKLEFRVNRDIPDTVTYYPRNYIPKRKRAEMEAKEEEGEEEEEEEEVDDTISV